MSLYWITAAPAGDEAPRARRTRRKARRKRMWPLGAAMVTLVAYHLLMMLLGFVSRLFSRRAPPEAATGATSDVLNVRI